MAKQDEPWAVLSSTGRRGGWQLVEICRCGEAAARADAQDMADQEDKLGGKERFAVLSLRAYDAGRFKQAKVVKPSREAPMPF